jgi:hypothetical protein
MIRNYMIKLAKEGNFKDIPEEYRAKLKELYSKQEPKKAEQGSEKKDDKGK